MIAILAGVRRYLIVLLIYIALVINDIEHLFMCLLPMCFSSLEKHLLSFLPIFKIEAGLFFDTELYATFAL